MKALFLLAVVMAGAPAFAAPAGDPQASGADQGPRVCALFRHARDGSRRICLAPSEWQDRLGPDWRQVLTGRNYEDDMAALGPRTRDRPVLPPDCFRCREMPPPRSD